MLTTRSIQGGAKKSKANVSGSLNDKAGPKGTSIARRGRSQVSSDASAIAQARPDSHGQTGHGRAPCAAHCNHPWRRQAGNLVTANHLFPQRSTDTVSDPLFATQMALVFGSAAMANGSRPAGPVAATVSVRPLITETVLSIKLAT